MGMSLTPGTRLGPYEILGSLGAGGMGEVYRALDTRLGRAVAVKVIPAELARDPDRIARVEREARAAGAVNHPGVCALFDVGTHAGSPFVVMELLEGQSMRERLRSGPLTVRTSAGYIAQAADALAAVHEKGVVHRDLKPDNLFVTKDGRVKVLDFGLAKLTGPDQVTSADTQTAPVTEIGAVLGTVGYLSPEQVNGQPADSRSDVFALGAILYELVTGARAFHGATAIETLHAILHDEPAPLSTVRPEAPAPLARILRHCLAKDPERRLQTSKDLRNQLEDLLCELDAHSSDEPQPERRWDPIERQLPLTAAHVRQLSVRNPRLIGHPLVYLDNRIESDTLVVYFPGLGGDCRQGEGALRVLPYRAISTSLIGFAKDDTYRPVMGFDDHSQVLRILLRELVQEIRPATTVLVGVSAGADQCLRMIAANDGAGVEVAAIVALGPNLGGETCFVSKQYAGLDAGDPDTILDVLKAIGQHTRPLQAWLALQGYITHTFTKFGLDLEPLKRYAADLVAPFENNGDPLPGWYRAATQRVPGVRIVFSNEEAGLAEALLERHLEANVLGDDYFERSYVIEPTHHLALFEPELVARHVEDALAQLAERRGLPRLR